MRWYLPLACLLAAAAGPAAAGLAGEEDVVALFADLPARFVVQAVEESEAGRTYRLRSAEPISESGGAVTLRATVRISPLAETSAGEEIRRRLAAADPDTGLSYAWDYVVAAEGSLIRLHAGCLFSEESFRKVALALARSLAADAGAPAPSFWCRCGGACRAGAPFAGAADAARRLPPVRRPPGVEPIEEGEYDNRLDPSGSWRSSIGELSLMHYADALSFSYSAVFGATAHICEGAGVAGLVATDRYEYVDEQGTVAFQITDTAVRLEPVAGIASFCGAGWAGDRFTIEGFEPPAACTVAAPGAVFHVVDHLDPETSPARARRGDAVEVAPAPHDAEDVWRLARRAGRETTVVGLLARGALDCPQR